MQVNRITLDRELGLIHLETGPGGDGNYVLLPLPIPELVKHYIDTDGWYSPDTTPEETIKNANGDVVRLEGNDTYVIDESSGPVNIQAPMAEVPKSAKPGCQCGAHRKNQFDGQLLGTPDPFPVLAFVRKAKYPTWYVTVPSVARLRIDGIHSDSIHLIPGMVRAEIDKLTGRQVSTERIHLVFPHETGSEL